MYDLIIIGAGTAGLTAALYALRDNKSVLILEKNVVGGQIINTPQIENYPALDKLNGKEYVERLLVQVDSATIKYEAARRIVNLSGMKYVYTDKSKYIGKSVIIATGLVRKKLGIEGEDELLGRGVSYCATCDGPFFKGKDVAVVGGGNTAVLEAIHLAQYCHNVYLICRGERFKGEEKNIEKLKAKSNIIIMKNTIPKKIIGKDKVLAIEIKSVKVKSVNSKVVCVNMFKRNDEIIKDKNEGENVEKIGVSGIFVAIGLEFDRNLAFDGISDKDDFIMSDENCRTSIEGIFVAGDCRNKKVRQLVTANADGAVAALAALEYINYKLE